MKEHLENLIKHDEDMVIYLNNQNKVERERSVCRAFLRAIGVAFEETELKAPAPTGEPSDVDFRSARFQIMEILEPIRKRDCEWKEKLKKNKNLKAQYEEWEKKEDKDSEPNPLTKLLESYSPPISIELQELVPEIVQKLSKKARKYGSSGCGTIDALVYVNLKDRYLAAHSDIPNLDELKSQGWRSVSFLFSPYGVILFAEPQATNFIRTLEAGQYMKYKDIYSLFEA